MDSVRHLQKKTRFSNRGATANAELEQEPGTSSGP